MAKSMNELAHKSPLIIIFSCVCYEIAVVTFKI